MLAGPWFFHRGGSPHGHVDANRKGKDVYDARRDADVIRKEQLAVEYASIQPPRRSHAFSAHVTPLRASAERSVMSCSLCRNNASSKVRPSMT